MTRGHPSHNGSNRIREAIAMRSPPVFRGYVIIEKRCCMVWRTMCGMGSLSYEGFSGLRFREAF
jgi:hypothetical protein